jgi:hypothetical protein
VRVGDAPRALVRVVWPDNATTGDPRARNPLQRAATPARRRWWLFLGKRAVATAGGAGIRVRAEAVVPVGLEYLAIPVDLTRSDSDRANTGAAYAVVRGRVGRGAPALRTRAGQR